MIKFIFIFLIIYILLWLLLFSKLHKVGISLIMATHDYNMIVKFPGKIYQCDQKGLNEVITKK